MRSEFISIIDDALWQSWGEIESVLEMTEEDASDVFKRFVNEDYIYIIEKTCDAVASFGSFTPPFPPEAHASEKDQKQRLSVLKDASTEQSSKAVALMKERYTDFRAASPKSKYLPEDPPSKYAVENYYALLQEIVESEGPSKPLPDAASGSSSKRDATASESLVVSPVRRKRPKNWAEPKRMNVADLLGEARVGDMCHFEGCVVYCDDEMNTVDTKNKRTDLVEHSDVLHLALADKTGVVQVTLWRETATEINQRLQKEMDDSVESSSGKIPKITLTNLVVRDPKYSAVNPVRTLHSTEKTKMTLGGHHQLHMAPDLTILVTDFRKLKGWLPFIVHLKGVVVGEKHVRYTVKGAEQICFTLMDRHRRTVPCIAHDVSFGEAMFTEGKELVIFYGVKGLKRNPGSVFIYPSGYVLSLFTTELYLLCPRSSDA